MSVPREKKQIELFAAGTLIGRHVRGPQGLPPPASSCARMEVMGAGELMTQGGARARRGPQHSRLGFQGRRGCARSGRCHPQDPDYAGGDLFVFRDPGPCNGSWCHWPAERGEAWELRAQPLSAQMGKLSPTGLHSFGTVHVFLLRAVWEAQSPLVSLSGGDVEEGPPPPPGLSLPTSAMAGLTPLLHSFPASHTCLPRPPTWPGKRSPLKSAGGAALMGDPG